MINIIPFASSSAGNMYVVKNEDTKILLECGLPKDKIQKNLSELGLLITDLNACIISHIHEDHSLSIKWVSDYIETYSTNELCKKWSICRKISPLIAFKIGNIKVLGIPLEHGKTENLGFVFMDKESCVFFATDFSLMRQNLSNFKFDKIYIECNYDDDLLKERLAVIEDSKHTKYMRQISTHMSKKNCIEHLKHMDLSKCKEIILLHPSAFLISKLKTKSDFEKELKIKTNFAKEK